MSFQTGDSQLSQRIVSGTRLWGVSVSFGCVNSLISMPCLMSHASIDAKVRAERGLPEDIIRISVGIEDVDDLIDDLNASLLAAGAVQKDTSGKLIRVTPGIAGPLAAATGSSASSPASASASPLLVSAPGKVILFGEHAVVHGVTALAASVGLRCYALVQPRADGKLHLELPDLAVSHDWNISDLPWDDLPSTVGGINVNTSVQAAKDLDAKLLRRIVHTVETQGGAIEGDRSHASCVAFLYLYMSLAKSQTSGGQTFTFRSLLPIGAGLGSSASYSACLASALIYTHGHLPLPQQGGQAISTETASKINDYAFLAEKVIHGNPSGVDNSVAVFGGCLAFTRPQSPRNQLTSNELKLLSGVHEKKFLLTDTVVPRDTKSLVAGVKHLLETEPARVNGILDSIQSIVNEATKLLASGASSGADESRLGDLIRTNHDLLVQLGVSHPSLESIRNSLQTISSTSLPTKLTGAGGGGCAVTLLPSSSSSDSQQQLSTEATTALERLGYKVYTTTVGGPGVSVLCDVDQVQRSSLVGRDGEEGGIRVEESLEKRFASVDASRLGAWLEAQGELWSRVG